MPFLAPNDIRDRLHWLPVKQRIDFKLGLLVYKCLHGEAPSYLVEMLEHKSDNPALLRLRNTATRRLGKLVVPRSRLKTLRPRSFATTGPSLWNSLPTEVTDETLNISTFKIRLKTFLFKQSFPDDLRLYASCASALCDGLAIKKRYMNVLYITLHYNQLGLGKRRWNLVDLFSGS